MAMPAFKESLEQSAQSFDEGFPLVQMISEMIKKSISGDTEFFANSPLAKRKGSMARSSGDKRKETTRRGLAARGLEQTGAGQATLNDQESQTSSAVLDAMLSEMGRYLDVAPQFALGLTGQAQQTSSRLAGVEQQREGSDPFNSILPMLITTAATAAGTAFGGPLGGAAGAMLGGLVSGAAFGGKSGAGFGGGGGTDLGRSWMGPTPGNVTDVSIGGGFVS